MNDQEFLSMVKRIKTPREMLSVILKYEDYLGYDPYFGDLRRAMLGRAQQILDTPNKKVERTKRRARDFSGWTPGE